MITIVLKFSLSTLWMEEGTKIEIILPVEVVELPPQPTQVLVPGNVTLVLWNGFLLLLIHRGFC